MNCTGDCALSCVDLTQGSGRPSPSKAGTGPPPLPTSITPLSNSGKQHSGRSMDDPTGTDKKKVGALFHACVHGDVRMPQRRCGPPRRRACQSDKGGAHFTSTVAGRHAGHVTSHRPGKVGKRRGATWHHDRYTWWGAGGRGKVRWRNYRGRARKIV